MITLLLIMIYIAFVSLGLPDTLLGSAWPVMKGTLGATTEMAGIISFTISAGTVVSSLLSSRITHKLGTGKVVLTSVFLTAAALIGFSFSSQFWMLIVLAIPLGLGAGAVDAALNNFVSLHFKAKHMNWLHCFWGIGAMSGPIIMSYFLKTGEWQNAYLNVGIIQTVLVILLIFSLPLWKSLEKKNVLSNNEPEETKFVSNKDALKLPGAKPALIAFFCYCALEVSAGLWCSSFFVEYKQITPQIAAGLTSLFFGGITAGRLLSGFLTAKFSTRILIRTGEIVCILGCVLLLLPLPYYFSAAGLLIIGLGCAPIYPGMIHETPVRFGKNASRSITGMEMATAYIGSTLAPPLIGFISAKTGLYIMAVILFIAAIVLFFSTERVNKIISSPKFRLQD